MTQAVWQNQHINFRYRNETAVQRCNPQRRSPFRQFAASSKYLQWKECKCGEITTGGAQQINTFRYPNLDFSSPLSGSAANISALPSPNNTEFFSLISISRRDVGEVQLAFLHGRSGRHTVHNPQALSESEAHRVGGPGDRVRSLRHSHPAERCHQEAEQTLPECDACKTRLSGVQAHETSQSQEHHRWLT